MRETRHDRHKAQVHDKEGEPILLTRTYAAAEGGSHELRMRLEQIYREAARKHGISFADASLLLNNGVKI